MSISDRSQAVLHKPTPRCVGPLAGMVCQLLQQEPCRRPSAGQVEGQPLGRCLGASPCGPNSGTKPVTPGWAKTVTVKPALVTPLDP